MVNNKKKIYKNTRKKNKKLKNKTIKSGGGKPFKAKVTCYCQDISDDEVPLVNTVGSVSISGNYYPEYIECNQKIEICKTNKIVNYNFVSLIGDNKHSGKELILGSNKTGPGISTGREESGHEENTIQGSKRLIFMYNPGFKNIFLDETCNLKFLADVDYSAFDRERQLKLTFISGKNMNKIEVSADAKKLNNFIENLNKNRIESGKKYKFQGFIHPLIGKSKLGFISVSHQYQRKLLSENEIDLGIMVELELQIKNGLIIINDTEYDLNNLILCRKNNFVTDETNDYLQLQFLKKKIILNKFSNSKLRTNNQGFFIKIEDNINITKVLFNEIKRIDDLKRNISFLDESWLKKSKDLKGKIRTPEFIVVENPETSSPIKTKNELLRLL